MSTQTEIPQIKIAQHAGFKIKKSFK